jgi:membrane-bound lytic murein transglycosylase B
VPGSIAELEKESGATIADLHKPDIDNITITCKKCQKKVERVPEVLDSWIEAGSASFAERHFPFDADGKEISAEKQKEYLIKINKTNEKTYTQVLADQQAKAAEIRAKLFKLAGGSVAIPFGTALQYAQSASAKTGVSPAFVLAILTQESALGANVGKCYLSDTTTGAGYNVNTKVQYSNVMKPSRDLSPFLQITSRLGMDPLKTVISCPIPSAGGYGGAMGPAQFIASTWQTVSSRVSAITGSSNPWGARDSITASSIYLSDLGANSSYASQIKAACRYYGTGGSSCSYGTSVMSKVSGIQQKIDYLKQYGQ